MKQTPRRWPSRCRPLETGSGTLPKCLLYNLAIDVEFVIKKERLLARAHVDLRVLLQVVVEGGRPRFLRAYYEEVGHHHRIISPRRLVQEPFVPDLALLGRMLPS
jgi:hypothetical protein